MRTTLFLLALPTLSLAYPGYLGAESKAEILEQLNQQRAAEPEPEI
jgi:hypothetical protein